MANLSNLDNADDELLNFINALRSVFGDSPTEASVAVNPLITYAEAEILSTYGDTVSVAQKAKSLLKFGKNLDLDTGDNATVWTLASRVGTENETYVSTNLIDTISSSNAGDTQSVTIEGHTVTGTGTDQQFTFSIQTVTLNGQNKVTLTTPIARVSRAFNSGTTPFSGDIFVYEDTAITTGTPNDLTKAHIEIRGTIGDTQSFKAATTFSNSDYFICTGGFVSIRRNTAAAVDFTLEIRRPGGVFRPATRVNLNTTGSTAQQISFDPYVIVPKNSDIRVRASTSANNTQVDASFQGYLALVTS